MQVSVTMYGKAFASMYSGSMFGAGMHVFAVWNWVLANCGPDGLIDINAPVVAVTLGGTVEEVGAALAYLSDTDEHSRSDAEDGRRLIHLKGPCHKVVNHAHYAKLRTAQDRREYQRIWAKEKRRRQSVDSPSTQGGQQSTMLTHTDVDVDVHTHEDVHAGGGVSAPATQPSTALAKVPLQSLSTTDTREDVRRVWERLNALRKELIPRARGLKLASDIEATISARIKESEGGAKDVLDVLEHLAAECRGNPKQCKWFQASTIFARKNYRRYLGQLGSEEASQVTTTGLEGFDIGAARAELDRITGPVR